MNIYHFTHLLCYQLFMIQNTCCIIYQTQNDLMLKTPTRKIKICSEIQRERLVVRGTGVCCRPCIFFVFIHVLCVGWEEEFVHFGFMMLICF